MESSNDNMNIDDRRSETHIRLPMWVGLNDDEVEFIVDAIIETSAR